MPPIFCGANHNPGAGLWEDIIGPETAGNLSVAVAPPTPEEPPPQQNSVPYTTPKWSDHLSGRTRPQLRRSLLLHKRLIDFTFCECCGLCGVSNTSNFVTETWVTEGFELLSQNRNCELLVLVLGAVNLKLWSNRRPPLFWLRRLGHSRPREIIVKILPTNSTNWQHKSVKCSYISILLRGKCFYTVFLLIMI